MDLKFRSAFFAYPSGPPDLAATIDLAVSKVNGDPKRPYVVPWPQMDVFGHHISNRVQEQIAQADVIVCDVTKANPNVYYEAGYAIGGGKTVAPVLNSSFAGANIALQRDGIFDNIGYKQYENSDDLAEILRNLPINNLIGLYSRKPNLSQPLFLLDVFRKTDFRNAIVSAIKDSRVFYRSFDPVETPQFSAVSVISEATASGGIVIPLLAPHVDDASRHNLRAAFLTGLSHGLGRRTLVLELLTQGSPNPADFRDFVRSVRTPSDVSETVIPFAKEASVDSQALDFFLPSEKTPLQELSFGASAAENEFRVLGDYFVETSEFLKTLRGEVNLVAGRKGSGKTAIFFQTRDTFRASRNNIIIDLKPESHQLSLFREELLKLVDVGAFDHTIAAFWRFMVLSEILLSYHRYYDARRHGDVGASDQVKMLSPLISQFDIQTSGDFTNRLNQLASHAVREVLHQQRSGKKIVPDELTNIFFRGGIAQIMKGLVDAAPRRGRIVFLFDNIDKGWPSSGVDKFDVRMVRLLVEALDKLKRDFDAAHTDFMSVVFLRNDIYELLVSETPDRGKSGRIRIDWTDRAKLKQVILRRLQNSEELRDGSFEQLWNMFFAPRIDDQDSFEYFLDHCLMRPRFLINLLEYAVAHAVNRGHQQVSETDMRDAVRQHSAYLVDDFGYEIRDVSGLTADILYSLVGTTTYLTKGEVLQRLRNYDVIGEGADKAFRLFLWYGVLGVVGRDNLPHFIYDYEYSERRLEAEISSQDNDCLYVVNKALHVALNG